MQHTKCKEKDQIKQDLTFDLVLGGSRAQHRYL